MSNKTIEVEVNSWNRKTRRAHRKITGIKLTGKQDPKEAPLKTYWIQMKRKSKSGVEYIYYKEVVDKIDLDKK